MAHPTTWLQATQRSREAQHVVNAQIKKPSFIPCPHPTNPSAPLNIHKLTHEEMPQIPT
jgi:hypothetical protein